MAATLCPFVRLSSLCITQQRVYSRKKEMTRRGIKDSKRTIGEKSPRPAFLVRTTAEKKKRGERYYRTLSVRAFKSLLLSAFFFMTVTVLLLVLLFSVYFGKESAESAPPKFTTTVDLQNRTIRDTPMLQEKQRKLQVLLWKMRGPLEQIVSAAPAFLLASVGAESHERIVRVRAGMRKEEVAAEYARKLDWGPSEKKSFLALLHSASSTEGRLFEGLYTISKDATSTQVKESLEEIFREKVLLRYSPELEALLPLNTVLTVASLVERESAGNEADMGVIAGIFWNRIFSDEKLQSDVTLQYIKGNEKRGWWPRVYPQDKYLKSPYNTYRQNGLPPGPIASPSIDAITATLNPEKTECLFFLHDSKGELHCSRTYAEHRSAIQKYY